MTGNKKAPVSKETEALVCGGDGLDILFII
jgi:hypothetical protein